MKLQVVRLDPAAALPTKAHASDAGWDLYALDDTPVEAHPCGVTVVPTGLAVAVPDGWYLQLLDRSSLAVLGLTISGGVVDSGYRGELRVVMSNFGRRTYTFRRGQRLAQFVLLPVPHLTIEEVGTLPDSPRGAGGFGSSGG